MMISWLSVLENQFNFKALNILNELYVLSSFNALSSWRLGSEHSVESPSMVDPQSWYWGSKWNLHTVCWDRVGCEWGTTSVYFGITYVCFIPSRLSIFAVEPQYRHQDFLFLSKVSFEGHIQNLQKISCWFKIEMGFVGPILSKIVNVFHSRFSLIACVMASYANMLVTTQWPVKVQLTSPHLSGFVWYGGLKAWWGYLCYDLTRCNLWTHVWIKFMSSCEIALSWMPQNTLHDMSALIQMMAWCQKATSHYLCQCWPSSASPYGFILSQ